MRCFVAKCSATTCPHQHKCNRCTHWKLPSGFGTKSTGRKATCMICSEKQKVYNAKHNPINNAKNNAKNIAKSQAERAKKRAVGCLF